MTRNRAIALCSAVLVLGAAPVPDVRAQRAPVPRASGIEMSHATDHAVPIRATGTESPLFVVLDVEELGSAQRVTESLDPRIPVYGLPRDPGPSRLRTVHGRAQQLVRMTQLGQQNARSGGAASRHHQILRRCLWHRSISRTCASNPSLAAAIFVGVPTLLEITADYVPPLRSNEAVGKPVSG